MANNVPGAMSPLRDSAASLKAPWFGPRGAALALALAAVLAWPMVIVGGPLVYFDTFAYYHHGEQSIALLDKLIGIAEPDGPATTEADGETGIAGAQLRSMVYPLYFYLAAQTPLGIAGPAILQTWMTLFVLLALLPDGAPGRGTGWGIGGIDVRRAWPAGLALAGLATVTTLPWIASYAMPDMAAALLVASYAVMVRRVDDLTLWQVAILLALASFAASAHYGNLPLAAALAAVVIGYRLWRRNLGWRAALLCLAPVLVAAAANLLASGATTGSPSLAPKRLPILLARSLEDGPAVWYLTDACETEDYAICEMFDAVPDNVSDFLWSDDGIGAATEAQRERLRDEEFTILYRTFRAYPLAQAEALFGNALKQSVAVGTGQLLPPSTADLAAMEMHPPSSARDVAENHPALDLFDRIVPVGTLGFALLLGGLAAAGRVSRDLGEAALLVIVALAVNAAIFGGLSYPVDRYQSRIVWLLGALAVLALASPKSSGRSSA